MSDIQQNDGCYVSSCALCGANNLHIYDTLFESPLANNLFDNEIISKGASKFPLGLAQCCECGHIQLSFAVNPEKLFNNYSYKTGFSSAFRNTFSNMLKMSLINILKIRKKTTCIYWMSVVMTVIF